MFYRELFGGTLHSIVLAAIEAGNIDKHLTDCALGRNSLKLHRVKTFDWFEVDI